MTKSVWLVWHFDGQSRYLLAVCVTESDARQAADQRQRWLEDYHGPAYPCEWDQKLGEREFRNQFGDRVSWEERPLWGVAA